MWGMVEDVTESFVANFVRFLAEKEVWRLVEIWELEPGKFFGDTV